MFTFHILENGHGYRMMPITGIPYPCLAMGSNMWPSAGFRIVLSVNLRRQ